jgi:predicted outer membrane repeat protein
MRQCLPICLIALVGCPPATETPATPGAVDAGDDQSTVPCATVTLDGTGSADAVWSQSGGPALPDAGLGTAGELMPTFTVTETGTYTFVLTDGDASDEMTVTVALVVDTLDDVVADDDGMLSLREAVTAAQACPGPHTVEVAVTGTSTFTETLVIDDPLDAADNTLRIESSTDFVMTTSAGRLAQIDGATVEIVDGVFADVAWEGDNGGGNVLLVYPDAALTLTGGIVRDNTDTDFLFGSQIYVGENSTLTMTDVTASGNSTAIQGGVIETAGSTTVIGGTFSDNSADGRGGAIRATDGTLTVDGTVFTNNTSGSSGGAISTVAAALVVDGATFTDNTATESGGAISSDSAASFLDGSVVVDDSTFTGNSSGGVGGGAIVLSTLPLTTITGSTFATNTTTGSGGGIYTFSDLTVTGGSFTDNAAYVDGGGLHGSNLGNDLTVTLQDVTFTGNDAVGDGGAVDLESVDGLTVSGSTFSGNTAASDGGGLSLGLGGPGSISGSTISGNTATVDGGGIAYSGESGDPGPGTDVLTLDNTTVTGNTAEFGGGIHAFGDVVLTDGASVSANTATADGGVLNVGGGVCNELGDVFGPGVATNTPDDLCNP